MGWGQIRRENQILELQIELEKMWAIKSRLEKGVRVREVVIDYLFALLRDQQKQLRGRHRHVRRD